jgi:hypothetical protein
MRREYAVTYTIERTQTAQVTVQVTALNEDNAEDLADDEYHTDSLVDKIDDDEWTTTNESIENTEVQEI